ncbi:MAG: hypothetical protein HYV09_18770 [Deltaproteobacteria bacterium]|nr:hypothetical protein [Deltaproteobacteria bacterium]
MKHRLICAFALWSVIGCSGGNFDVAAEDAGGDAPETCAAKNACGGCGALAVPPGTACGACGTLKTECNTDKESTFCPGDDRNACGGCSRLVPDEGTSCGVCSGGTNVCFGNDATKCSDPVTTPAPGTACGTCGTSTFKCVGSTTTACDKPDDRTSGTDSLYGAHDASVWTLSASGEPIAIGFTTQRDAAITEVVLSVVRYETSSYPLFGTMRVRLLRGTGPGSTDVLATVSVPGDSLPDAPGTLTVKLATPTSLLPKGTRVFVELLDQSERYNFGVFGGAPTGPAHLGFFYRTSSGGADPTWTEYTSADPYLAVGQNGCF